MRKEEFALLSEEQKEAHRQWRRERQRAWTAAKKLGHVPATDGKKRKIDPVLIKVVAPHIQMTVKQSIASVEADAAKKEAKRIEVKERIARRKETIKAAEKKKKLSSHYEKKKLRQQAKEEEIAELARESKHSLPIYLGTSNEFLVRLLQFRLWCGAGSFHDEIREAFPDHITELVPEKIDLKELKPLFPVKRKSLNTTVSKAATAEEIAANRARAMALLLHR